MLHVAITRGRQRVVVLADSRRPSPFLAELARSGAAPASRPARVTGGRAGDPAIEGRRHR